VEHQQLVVVVVAAVKKYIKIMNKFIKSTGPDPFLVDPNDFNPGFFGHLNALVAAITELQNNGGGGGGGGNIAVYQGAAVNPLVSVLASLRFTGNVTASISSGGGGAITVNVPNFSVSNIPDNAIPASKLFQIDSQRLLGRYSTGLGDIQSITIGDGLLLNSSGVLSNNATGTTVVGTAGQISVDTVSNTSTIALEALSPNPAKSAVYANVTVDAYGRVTEVADGSIDTIALTTGTISTLAVNGNDIANKTYVDTYVQGLLPKESVRLATTGNLASLSGTLPVDGIRPTTGIRILVKDQTDSTQNGIYEVGPTPSFTWTRTTDADTVAKLISAYVFVQRGTANADSGWVCTVDTGTIPTAPIPWKQFTSVVNYSAGTGISLLNNTISLTDLVSSNTVGSATIIPQITVNPQGRITNITPATPSIDLGTMVTGTLPVSHGSTGLTSYTLGDILYANSTSSLATLSVTGNDGKVLTVESGSPIWKTPTSGFTNPMNTKGQMIYASAGTGGAAGTGTPAILPISPTDGFVLTYNTSTNIPQWAAPTGSNPTRVRGDIMYASAPNTDTGTPGTLAKLPIGTLGQYLKVVDSGSGVLLPSWQPGLTTPTVISFVVDGYGGPIVAPSPGVIVFKVKAPFTGSYTSLDISPDVVPGGTATLSLTATASGTITGNMSSAGTVTFSPVGPVNVIAGAFITFTIINSAASNVTKLFVNLTGTRS
jgi:hypothetical protein